MSRAPRPRRPKKRNGPTASDIALADLCAIKALGMAAIGELIRNEQLYIAFEDSDGTITETNLLHVVEDGVNVTILTFAPDGDEPPETPGGAAA